PCSFYFRSSSSASLRYLFFYFLKSFFSAPASASRIPSQLPALAPSIPPTPTVPPRSAGHRPDRQSASLPGTPAPSTLPAAPRQIADAAKFLRTPALQSFLFQYVRDGPRARPAEPSNRSHEIPARSRSRSRRQSARLSKPARPRF